MAHTKMLTIGKSRLGLPTRKQGPNLAHHVLVKKICWNTAMPIHVSTICGHFCAMIVELLVGTDLRSKKPKNIYSSFIESLLYPDLDKWYMEVLCTHNFSAFLITKLNFKNS